MYIYIWEVKGGLSTTSGDQCSGWASPISKQGWAGYNLAIPITVGGNGDYHYVCMYVYMYICMYVSFYVYVNICTYMCTCSKRKIWEYKQGQ